MKKVRELLDKTQYLVDQESKDYSFTPEIVLVGLYTVLILCAWVFTDVSLVGNKQVAVFDFWFFVHVLAGATVSVVLFRLRYFKLHHPIILLLLISVHWELLEVYLESGLLTSSVANWLGGTEHFFNRFLGDQLAMLIGFTIVKARPNLYGVMLTAEVAFVAFHLWVGDSTFLL